jgi:hypothetical protein
MSGVPDLASSYCVLHAVDILNALPTKANPTDGTTDVTGFSPYLKYYGSQPSMDSFYVFGSYCSVHMDDDHVDKTNKNVTASPCVYLCNAGHFKSKGHVVWDYKRRRKLIVPEISRNIWNYFPMRNGPAKHLSDLLTFVEARVDDSSELLASSTKISAMHEIDPSSDDFPNNQVRLDAAEIARLATDLASSPQMATMSKYKTRQRDRMLQNVGTKIRRVFFINGPNGPTDFFHGVVRSVTAANKYDVVYDDYDEEEMGEADFEIYKMKVKDQVVVKLANAQNARIWKDANDCNCAIGHCYHPWSKNTSGFNPKEGGAAFVADVRMQESSMRKTPSSIALPMLISMRLSALHI